MVFVFQSIKEGETPKIQLIVPTRQQVQEVISTVLTKDQNAVQQKLNDLRKQNVDLVQLLSQASVAVEQKYAEHKQVVTSLKIQEAAIQLLTPMWNAVSSGADYISSDLFEKDYYTKLDAFKKAGISVDNIFKEADKIAKQWGAGSQRFEQIASMTLGDLKSGYVGYRAVKDKEETELVLIEKKLTSGTYYPSSNETAKTVEQAPKKEGGGIFPSMGGKAEAQTRTTGEITKDALSDIERRNKALKDAMSGR